MKNTASSIGVLTLSLILILLLSPTAVALMGPGVKAQKRCAVVLNPNSCDLNDCRKECYQSRNGNGFCQADPNFKYHCVCAYNC